MSATPQMWLARHRAAEKAGQVEKARHIWRRYRVAIEGKNETCQECLGKFPMAEMVMYRAVPEGPMWFCYQCWTTEPS